MRNNDDDGNVIAVIYNPYKDNLYIERFFITQMRAIY